jgi:hypothetical protein
MDAGSPNASKIFAVPITKFQSDVLRSLAAYRSPDSYIAGGVAINREGPRFSADIDIFHDSEVRLESAARTEGAAGAGLLSRERTAEIPRSPDRRGLSPPGHPEALSSSSRPSTQPAIRLVDPPSEMPAIDASIA